jgi:hypothetical protein
LYRNETNLYRDTHSQAILKEERTVLQNELSVYRQENNAEDRIIKQNRLAQSKKEQESKDRADNLNSLRKELEGLEKGVFEKSWELDRLTAKFKDPELVKRATEEMLIFYQLANQTATEVKMVQS